MRSYRTIALATLALTSMLPACGAAKEAAYAPSAGEPSPQAAYPQSYPQPYAQPGQAPMADADGAGAPAEEAEAQTAADAAPPPPPAPAPPRQALEKKVAAAKTPAIAGGAVADDDGHGSEDYTDYGVNPVTDPAKDALSTFAIDVDTGAYAIARSKLQSNTLPPFQSVRAEEYVNYFDYEYQGPTGGSPFAVHLHAAPSPYQRGHQILRVGLQAKRVSKAQRKPVHLVYLVDTSGSMNAANKLGLAKKSLKILTKELKPTDTVALCTYAGSTRLVLPPTAGSQRDEILRAIDDLTSGGGTAMSNGMEMAYELAQKTHVRGHVSRVIVLSDGDANI
ncbi:MAG: von Willebrand factor type A domain-containing protein, partial [Polyangiaceae bacterium]